MGLEKRKPRKFLSIYNGKIRHKDGDSDTYYDSLTGVLKDITLKVEEYQGVKSRRWYFTFTDGGEQFILKSGEDTVFANSLMNCLGSADLSRPIMIAPYVTGDKEIAVPYVEQSGEQVPWAMDELPDEPEKRKKLMRKFASRLNEIIANLPEPEGEDEDEVVPVADQQPLSPSESQATISSEDLSEELYDDDLPF